MLLFMILQCIFIAEVMQRILVHIQSESWPQRAGVRVAGVLGTHWGEKFFGIFK